MNVIICFLTISKSLQTEFSATTHPEGALRWNKEKSPSFRVGNQRTVISVVGGQDLGPKNVNDKNLHQVDVFSRVEGVS